MKNSASNDTVVFACAAALRKRKNSHASFRNAEVVEIESLPNAYSKPNTSRGLSYEHSPEYQLLESSCAAHVARMKALSWNESMCKEYGLPCLFDRNGNDSVHKCCYCHP